jgi:6-phosphofructokinase 2
MGEQSIVTVTPNPAIDLNASVERVEPDRKLACEGPTREPGGGGLNVSRALRILGGDSLALWAKGGVTGQLLHELLDQETIQHRPIHVLGDTRENVHIHETSTGKMYRFGMPGPVLSESDAALILEEIRRLDPQPAYVVASGRLPPGIDEGLYAQIAAAVAGWGGRMVLDASGESLRRAVEEGPLYLVKPNLGELAWLEGRPLDGDADVERAARRLVDSGRVRAVVVSMGPAGALVVAEDGSSERIPAPPVRVESRIGAGDSMVAAIVLGLSRGEPLTRAARLGVAAGTAAVTTPGTQLCRRADAERLYEEMPPSPAAPRPGRAMVSPEEGPTAPPQKQGK